MQGDRFPLVGRQKGASVATTTVFLIDEQAMVRAELRAAFESEPGMAIAGEAADASAVASLLRITAANVVVIGLAERESADVIRTIRAGSAASALWCWRRRQSRTRSCRALQAGAHGVVLRHDGGHAVVDAVRAVQAGGTFIGDAASAALLKDYVSQRSGLEIASPLQRLSQRERQVMDLVVSGMTSSEIGRQLAISPKSVGTYRSRLMSKLGVPNVPGLVKFAIQSGLVQKS